MEDRSKQQVSESSIKGLRASCFAKALAIYGSKAVMLGRIAENDAIEDTSLGLPGMRATCLAKGLAIWGGRDQLRARISARDAIDNMPHGLLGGMLPDGLPGV